MSPAGAIDSGVCEAIPRLLDETRWRVGLRADGVEVAFGHPGGSAVIGYRTTTEHDASVDTLAAFLGDGLLDAFSQMNARFAFGEVVDDELGIVRTGFTMPWPFEDREFLHTLEQRRRPDGVHIVGYGPLPVDRDPPPRAGFIRCPIEPSGQRITPLPNGRTRVEHLMTYALAGRVSPWAQNRVMHRGHLGAYRDEWSALVARSATLAEGSS